MVLVLLLALSLYARGAGIGDPCRQPCSSASAHVLVFDETYYVNAARVIAGIHPPAGSPYHAAPLGVDPNAEHPQLAKLIMAGAIELFGDGPLAWRLGSLVFGTLAMLGVYVLARTAGASRPASLACAGAMALDNLTLVAGRIGILDIYVLAAMVWGVAAYVRGRPWLAGAIVALAGCLKEVGMLALLVLALVELLPGAPRRGWRAWLRCGGTGVAGFVGLLWLLGAVARPYDDANRLLLARGLFTHINHILSYGAGQISPHGPRGIASYPWAWLIDQKPIVYLNIDPSSPAPGLVNIQPAVHFIGLISPPILVLALPWLLGWILRAPARRVLGNVRAGGRVHRLIPRGAGGGAGKLSGLAAAWFLGTWTPFAVAALAAQRTSYLYYMIIVTPALYLACGEAVAVGLALRGRWRPVSWPLTALWWAAMVAAAVLLYPLLPAL